MSSTTKVLFWGALGGIIGALTAILVTAATGSEASTIVVAVMHLAVTGSFVGLWLAVVMTHSAEHEDANVPRTAAVRGRSADPTGIPHQATA